jgi:tRNA-Thr(GGU) m(6)t(6)A37 methyltransferase TsaA
MLSLVDSILFFYIGSLFVSIVFEPIGEMVADLNYKYEFARQSNLAENQGYIELNRSLNCTQSLKDLEGFERIWVVYQFHLNQNWKPMVLPPRGDRNTKRGVFATRSPYRPNSIGLSCVELVRIEGNKIFIKNFDILNETPILDIKPYLPYSDSFPNSSIGWLEEAGKNTDEYFIEYSDYSAEQLEFIIQRAEFNLKNTIEVQLSINPTDNSRKRVKEYKEGFLVAIRTWRIHFSISENIVFIKNIFSSYSYEDLYVTKEDKYGDKELHRSYNQTFGLQPLKE